MASNNVDMPLDKKGDDLEMENSEEGLSDSALKKQRDEDAWAIVMDDQSEYIT